jgi:hypothetical protein
MQPTVTGCTVTVGKPGRGGCPPALIPPFRERFAVLDAYQPIGAVAVGHPDPAADQGGSSRVIRRRT